MNQVKSIIADLIADYSGLDRETIVSCEFQALALDSSLTIGIIADLCDEFDVDLPQEVFYHCNNIDELSRFIEAQVSVAA